MMLAAALKCVSVPTESILFNIDIEGPLNKDKTAVLRVFAKMFYNHLGFYGDDLKIARLERFIEKQGKQAIFFRPYGWIVIYNVCWKSNCERAYILWGVKNILICLK